MAVFPVGRATRLTLRESVTGQLRDAIGDGTLAAGTHLAEVDLSGSLGVSRATLREALRELQQEGLLVQDQRGRVSVRAITSDDVSDIFEVRTGLEQIAVGRLCALPDRAPAVTVLRGKLNRLRHRVSLAEDLDADLSFHGAMCELAGNQTLHQAWVNISGLVRVTMIAAGPQPARENMAFERHRPIVDLIEAGDAKAAHRFLAGHMASAARRLAGQAAQPD